MYSRDAYKAVKEGAAAIQRSVRHYRPPRWSWRCIRILRLSLLTYQMARLVDSRKKTRWDGLVPFIGGDLLRSFPSEA